MALSKKNCSSSHAKSRAESGGEMVIKLESSQMQTNLSFIKLCCNLSLLTIIDVVLLLSNGDPLSTRPAEMRKTAPFAKQKTVVEVHLLFPH